MTSQHDEGMSFRIPAGTVTGAQPAPAPRPAFIIVIPAQDGTELVRMTEDAGGRLVVTGDESRWDEGAKRFLHGMMQWSGQVGIAWKDEVKKAAQEGGW